MALGDAWRQLADALPTMNDKQRASAERQMKEIAEEASEKLRLLLGS